jgi:hypothetical protein
MPNLGKSKSKSNAQVKPSAGAERPSAPRPDLTQACGSTGGGVSMSANFDATSGAVPLLRLASAAARTFAATSVGALAGNSSSKQAFRPGARESCSSHSCGQRCPGPGPLGRGLSLL